MSPRTWSEIRPLLAEHGILQADVDGPVVVNDELIAMVRQRVEQNPNVPLDADEVEEVMRAWLADAHRQSEEMLRWISEDDEQQ